MRRTILALALLATLLTAGTVSADGGVKDTLKGDTPPAATERDPAVVFAPDPLLPVFAPRPPVRVPCANPLERRICFSPDLP